MVVVKKYFQFFFIVTALLIAGLPGLAQNNGLLQQIDLSDNYRLYQLTDSIKSVALGIQNHSFMIRPLKFVEKARWTKGYLSLENVSYSRYYNDSLGTGYNNGSFFQATGWQDRFSLGVRAKLGGLEINLQPELVLAQNKVQAAIADIVRFSDPNYFSRFYFMNINVIDLPSRFGTKSITKIFPGQSSIQYHIAGFSAGVSTENIWWGPGTRNSLVMTNQAPGFLHLALQTDKPLLTKAGSFEAQLIYGRLDSSGIEPIENIRQASIWPGAYFPRSSQSNRDIAAMMITWQPKWIPNLYLGFAASYYFYTNKTDSLGNPFPEYPYTSSAQSSYETGLGSLSFRYAMPSDKAEIYFEIGRGDKPATIFNLFGDTIPLAYTGGVRKLIQLKKRDQFIEFSAEITHLQLPDPRLIFTEANPYGIPKTKSWYTHPAMRQGYTNYGQMLGAGIGPGSNSQTLNISWVKGSNKIGLHAERVIHNEDFYYYHYINSTIGLGSANRHWTDLSYGLHGQLSYKNLFFACDITSVSALNYQWVKVDGTLDGPSMSDKKNIHVAVSLLYSFNKRLPIDLSSKKNRQN